MKVVIFAGGYGTRLAELTREIPKPMVEIGGFPILWHIMKIYGSYGYNEFVIALGYKGEIIKEYFLNYHSHRADLNIDLNDGSVSVTSRENMDWKITLVDTGPNTMTGGRVKRLKSCLGSTFMLTYGDGIADIDLSKLLETHRRKGKLVTVTAVHPTSRYGKLDINDEQLVDSFVEKPEFDQDWINGGFMVVEPEFLDWIDGDDSVLEREPLEKAAATGNLVAYKHSGFWHCMDTLRDRNDLETLWQTRQPPWKKW